MLRIRLTRIGRIHAPAYRVVISEKRSKRDGKYIDLLGYYNPCVKPAEFKIDEQKYQQWIQKGAQPTEAVKQLLTKVELSG